MAGRFESFIFKPLPSAVKPGEGTERVLFLALLLTGVLILSLSEILYFILFASDTYVVRILGSFWELVNEACWTVATPGAC